MGSCFSVPAHDGVQAQGAVDSTGRSGSRRNENEVSLLTGQASAVPTRTSRRERGRTSLERQNTEARDQLLAGRGGTLSIVYIINPMLT
jgi:hypothetical protein